MFARYLLVTILSFFLSTDTLLCGEFEKEQKQYRRVRTAFSEKEPLLKALFAEKKISYPPGKLFIRIFKHEAEVELWAASAKTDTFSLLKKYSICASSGTLGPKRKQGDFQVPEGFYHIDRFNPVSNFYLSLGLNYPNASDRILSNRAKPGGDIFIHGDCVTIGCVPITDDKIKELYLAAVQAKDSGQYKIAVHIFPYRLKSRLTEKLLKKSLLYKPHITFWENLKPGYDYFEEKKLMPQIGVKNDGRYYIKK